MKKPSELPEPVNNLRKIWDAKKAEMKFTQTEAAAELGWSQGAISHYLNDITTLGPSAIIKFANFLEVDPRDIDPSVAEHLPNTRKLVVVYDSGNANKRIDEAFYVHQPEDAFYVRVQPGMLQYRAGLDPRPYGPKGLKWFEGLGVPDMYLLVCPLKSQPQPTQFLIQLKNKKHFDLYFSNAVPPKSKIKKQLAILAHLHSPRSSRR